MESVRFAFTAQEFPSCGDRVVVSLSVKRLVLAFQRRWFAATLMAAAFGAQSATEAESLSMEARLSPSLMV